MMLSDATLLMIVAAVGLVLVYFTIRNERASRRIVQSNLEIARKAEASDVETHNALKSIHTLVNSNLTAAIQGELNASRITLVSLKELAEFKIHEGIPPSQDTAKSIELAANRVGELEREMERKEEQTKKANEQEE